MSEYVILGSFITQMNMNSGLFINLQYHLIEQGLSALYFPSDRTCLCLHKQHKSVSFFS